jgi:hypothetical protein
MSPEPHLVGLVGLVVGKHSDASGMYYEVEFGFDGRWATDYISEEYLEVLDGRGCQQGRELQHA